jgi:hypothetical protein
LIDTGEAALYFASRNQPHVVWCSLQKGTVIKNDVIEGVAWEQNYRMLDFLLKLGADIHADHDICDNLEIVQYVERASTSITTRRSDGPLNLGRFKWSSIYINSVPTFMPITTPHLALH